MRAAPIVVICVGIRSYIIGGGVQFFNTGLRALFAAKWNKSGVREGD